MSTPYSDVFGSYLNKINDPKYALLDPADSEDDMLKLMDSAIVHFEYPKIDLEDKDDINQAFSETLDLKTLEILANLMVLEWLKRDINSVSLLKQRFSDRDFKLTSQAAHLESLLKLKKDKELDCEKLMKNYSYKNKNLPNFSGLAGDN